MNIERRRRWIDEVEAEISDVGLIVDKLRGRPSRSWFKFLFFRENLGRLHCVLRRLRRCPECRGKGTTPGQEWTGRPRMEYQVLVEEECPVCKGTGRI